MDKLIKAARIINPAFDEDFVGDILISGGVISKMAEHIEAEGAELIDASGLVAAPGLVDMHVHLREPGFTDKEDILTGCEAAAAGGVTSLLCMPNTKPTADNAETVKYILDKAKTAKAHVYVAAAITKGLKGEELCDIEALKKAGATALSDDGRPVVSTKCLAEAMKLAPKLGMAVCAHCEDLFLAQNWYMNEGETSGKIGINGVPNAAEDSGTAREIAIAAAYGVPVHICHVSTEGSVAMIRDAKNRGVNVSGETAPHYLLLTDKELLKKDADYRMNPPLRSEKDRLAMIEAVRDGTIEVIATDHAPHTPEEKSDFMKAPNGSIGMETSLSGAITALVETGVISLTRLIEMMSLNPAKILGIEAGTLCEGGKADIVLFDPKEKWTVEPEKLHGKSRNAVLKGMELTGKVKRTFLEGEEVYKA